MTPCRKIFATHDSIFLRSYLFAIYDICGLDQMMFANLSSLPNFSIKASCYFNTISSDRKFRRYSCTTTVKVGFEHVATASCISCCTSVFTVNSRRSNMYCSCRSIWKISSASRLVSGSLK